MAAPFHADEMKFENEAIENSDIHVMQALYYFYKVLVLIVYNESLLLIIRSYKEQYRAYVNRSIRNVVYKPIMLSILQIKIAV